uniref:Uncharacterized protein n=1 Tax=Anopheles farauti TaxID=69004 RepID=A0A182QKF7_9DIPT
MSDNELDRTLVHPEQSLDSIPYSTPPLLAPPSGDIGSSGTLRPVRPVRLDGGPDSPFPSLPPLPAILPGAAPLHRPPHAFARFHRLPSVASVIRHEPQRAYASLPLYLSKGIRFARGHRNPGLWFRKALNKTSSAPGTGDVTGCPGDAQRIDCCGHQRHLHDSF